MLRKELETWAKQVIETENTDLDSILNDSEKFKARIKLVTTEAALRKVEYNVISDTQDLVPHK